MHTHTYRYVCRQTDADTSSLRKYRPKAVLIALPVSLSISRVCETVMSHSDPRRSCSYRATSASIASLSAEVSPADVGRRASTAWRKATSSGGSGARIRTSPPPSRIGCSCVTQPCDASRRKTRRHGTALLVPTAVAGLNTAPGPPLESGR